MATRSRDFVGIAEGIKSHELSTQGTIERLKHRISELSSRKSMLDSQISYLEAAIAAAYEDTDDEGYPDYGLISALEFQKRTAESELFRVEWDLDSTSNKLEHSQSELESVLEEKAQTLFEIQERARTTSQNIALAGGMFGAYAGVGSALQGSMQTSLSALSQAASILGGSVSGSGFAGAENSTLSSGNFTSIAGGFFQGDLTTSPLAAFVGGIAGTGVLSALTPVSQFSLGSMDGSTPGTLPNFYSGQATINSQKPQNFVSDQASNIYIVSALTASDNHSAESETDTAEEEKKQIVSEIDGELDKQITDTQDNSADTPAVAETVKAPVDAENGDVEERTDIQDNSELQDAASGEMSDTEQDEYILSEEESSEVKVLKRNEKELLETGNRNIKDLLDAKADDYRDKGMSEAEIAKRLQHDKIDLQKEFLKDAFPGRDVPTDVFSSIEAGTFDKDEMIPKSQGRTSDGSDNGTVTDIAGESDSDVRGDEMSVGKKFASEILPTISDAFSDSSNTEDTHNAINDMSSSRQIASLADSANRLIQNGGVGIANLSGFHPKVAQDMADALEEAKRDFPWLTVSYIGSIQNQTQSIENDLVEFYRKKFASIENTGWSDEQIDEAAHLNASRFIRRNQMDDIDGIFAWSLRLGNSDPSRGGLSKYNGVAVNLDYAGDYDKFKSAKVQNVVNKFKPIGCDSPRATMDHELGHELDRMLGASRDPQINQWYQEMLASGKSKEMLSGYAAKNVAEFIAEAYSEYRNNSEPRETSQRVYRRLKELSLSR